MTAINLKAHFDGQSIQLDEPFELPLNAQLLITVLPSPNGGDEQAEWRELSRQALSRAYGPDEPDYSDADLVP